MLIKNIDKKYPFIGNAKKILPPIAGRSFIKIATIVIFAVGALISTALAHQPRIVEGDGIVQIQNSEASQAFYATLTGQPQIYEINSDKSFVFYINILAPKIKNVTSTNDFSAFVYQQTKNGPKLLSILAGPKFEWTEFYEPFANDKYFKGPEFKQEVSAGKYSIKIVQPNYQGKYVLVVGEKEEFWLNGIISSISTLPKVKVFFNKSPLTAYFNLVGAFLAAILIVIVILILLAIKLFKR